MMDEANLKTALPTTDLRFFETIDSTNNYALAWSEQGAPDGALVAAESQTAGRGRFQRRWVTVPGAALTFSLILRPTIKEAEHLALFTALGALALSETLHQVYGLESAIKWPNDVLLNRRKTAGILAEAAWEGSRALAVVLGIGVNIAPESIPPAGETLFPATCVEAAAGRKVERVAFLQALVGEIHRLRPEMDSPSFIKAWNDRLAFKGMPVQIEQAGCETLSGILLGINPGGSLQLQTSSGVTLSIEAGDVRLRPVNETINS